MRNCDENNEYIPLNKTTIKTGQSFGPISYTIKEQSHLHHLEYILSDNNSYVNFKDENLFPFEMYSFPRTLSIGGGYNKLNEIISIYGERIIYQSYKPNCTMLGYVFVNKIFFKNGLLYGIFNSLTSNTEGENLLLSKDILILINGSDKKHLKTHIEKTITNKAFTPSNLTLNVIGSIRLSFRHSWDDSLWRNNIHTDNYAQTLGYEKGLIEAPCLVDIILSNKSVKPLIETPFKICWNYFGPLYHGTEVNFLLNLQKDRITIFIINSEDESLLMKLIITKDEK